MYTYKNTVTGVVFVASSQVTGKNLEQVTDTPAESIKEPKPKKKTTKKEQ